MGVCGPAESFAWLPLPRVIDATRSHSSLPLILLIEGRFPLTREIRREYFVSKSLLSYAQRINPNG
jgi:hypothetical protein